MEDGREIIGKRQRREKTKRKGKNLAESRTMSDLNFFPQLKLK